MPGLHVNSSSKYPSRWEMLYAPISFALAVSSGFTWGTSPVLEFPCTSRVWRVVLRMGGRLQYHKTHFFSTFPIFPFCFVCVSDQPPVLGWSLLRRVTRTYFPWGSYSSNFPHHTLEPSVKLALFSAVSLVTPYCGQGHLVLLPDTSILLNSSVL